MVYFTDMIQAGLKKAPAYAAVGALIGAALSVGLLLLVIPGVLETAGATAAVGFGIVGALSGAVTGAKIATVLGAAESFDIQRASQRDAEQQADQGNSDEIAPPQPFQQSQQPFQDSSAKDNRRGGRGRG